MTTTQILPSAPSIAKIEERLNLDTETAAKIRARIKEGYEQPRHQHPSHAANAFMEELSKLGDFSGVESLYPEKPQILYCNAGDTYADTLIYNYETERVTLGCWVDLVGDC